MSDVAAPNKALSALPVFRTSTWSTMASASSTSMPRWMTATLIALNRKSVILAERSDCRLGFLEVELPVFCRRSASALGLPDRRLVGK